MVVAAGEGIVALERDRRVALALDAEGGVLVLAADIDVDIVQRHVEGAVFDLVDDLDDVGGDVFGCALEVLDRGLHDLSRFVLGLIVVIDVGDLEGCAGEREQASRRGAAALRAFGKGFAADGVVVGLVLVFIAAALGAAEVDHVFAFAVF